ncbi:MAG: hypothetical protein IJ748_03810 [Bacteroidales bacterium]|nr:hypothetical protein [Bacteroidales bacterium]
MNKICIFSILILSFVCIHAQNKNTASVSNAKNQGLVLVPSYIDDNNVIFSPQTQKKRRSSSSAAKVTEENPFPERVEAYISFDKGNAYYTKGGLNALDSLYMMTFSTKNNRFYKMTIIGYDDAEELSEENSSLARDRAVVIFKYFASREETEYIIKRTPSSYNQMCIGEVPYYIKYKMPFDFKWVNLYSVSEQERMENDISLVGKAHIIIEDDPEDCLGEYYNYDWPSRDTTLQGNYAIVSIPKGTLDYIHHTKDTIVYKCPIAYKEVMSFEQLTSNYSLIPHKKQYIINAGYIVVSPERKPDYSSCPDRDNFPANILVQVPIESQQQAAGLKFYGKTYKPNGEIVYKAIATRKIKDKDTKSQTLECSITPFQFDTIFLGKKIEEKEMSNYFYPAKEGEPGSFEAMGGWLKPFKLDKRGEYVIKDPMKAILRKPNTPYYKGE